MYQVNGEKHVVFTRITFFWGKWKAFNYRQCECRCYSIAAITGRWANHQKCLRNFLFKFNSWTNHQQINGKVIAAILTIKSFTKQQQFSFFFHYLSLFLCRQYALFQLASLSTANTMFTTTKPLGYNKIMCFGFFWVRQTKKAENYFITVITSVRTYRNVHWSMSELQTKKNQIMPK